MLQLLLIVAVSLVSSAPSFEEEGSAFIKLDRSPRTHQLLSHRFPPFLKSSISKESNSLKPSLQEMPKDPQMSNEAFQRRLVWENTIQKEGTREHDQILPLQQDVLKRAKCDALPFIQSIFRKNCVTLRIHNKFCFGQCNSFYIPGWLSEHPQPCMFCTPSRYRRVTFPMQCHGRLVSWVEVDLIEDCDCDTFLGHEFGKKSSEEDLLLMS